MWFATCTPTTSGCAAVPDPVLPDPFLPDPFLPDPSALPGHFVLPGPDRASLVIPRAQPECISCLAGLLSGAGQWGQRCRSVGSTVQVSGVNGAGQWGQRCRSVGSTVQVSGVNGAGQFLRWGPAPLKRSGWRFLAQVSRAKPDLHHWAYRPAPQTSRIGPKRRKGKGGTFAQLAETGRRRSLDRPTRPFTGTSARNVLKQCPSCPYLFPQA